MSLEEFFNKENKKSIYSFYTRSVAKPLAYEKVTKEKLYNLILENYENDPEIILRLCSIEELNILKSLLIEELEKKNYGYIEYLLLNNLQKNYLVLEKDNHFYIPEDLVNYVKMAINLLNEKENSFRDVTDSIIIGLIRIHNVLEVEEFVSLLKRYNCAFISVDDFKKYILKSPKLNQKIDIIKKKKKWYAVSLEYYFYEDVLELRNDLPYQNYTLENIISIGKYKIDLFKKPMFKFLNFLEMHLEPKFIDYIIDDLIGYMGLYINNLEIVKKISADIEELYKSIVDVLPYFPIWVFNGNDLDNLNLKK